MKELILNTVKDLVSNFLYYDRKEDEELMMGDIQKAILDETVTKQEIIDTFISELESGL